MVGVYVEVVVGVGVKVDVPGQVKVTGDPVKELLVTPALAVKLTVPLLAATWQFSAELKL